MTTLERPTSIRSMRGALPQARGPISEALFTSLARSPGSLSSRVVEGIVAHDALFGDDAPLALYCLYELHNRGFMGVIDDWEWDPTCLELRRHLESAFVRQLRYELFLTYGVEKVRDRDIVREVSSLGRATKSRLASFIATVATPTHVRELAIHRSLFGGREIDPQRHSVSRLRDRTGSLTDLARSDELERSSSSSLHAQMYRTALESTGIDPRHGAYLECVPGATLSSFNLVTMFALHRRWRAALVGHVARHETYLSSLRSYAAGFERLEMKGAVEYCEAQNHAGALVHCTLLDDFVADFVAGEPELSEDVLFGARAFDFLENSFTTRLLSAWSEGKSSLRPPTHDETATTSIEPALFYEETHLNHSVC